jgi:DNA-binding NarL/FixJ family response regulator
MRAGASGFMLKNAPPDQLATAVRTVAAGDALLAPAIHSRTWPTTCGPRRGVVERQAAGAGWQALAQRLALDSAFVTSLQAAKPDRRRR